MLNARIHDRSLAITTGNINSLVNIILFHSDRRSLWGSSSPCFFFIDLFHMRGRRFLHLMGKNGLRFELARTGIALAFFHEIDTAEDFLHPLEGYVLSFRQDEENGELQNSRVEPMISGKQAFV